MLKTLLNRSLRTKVNVLIAFITFLVTLLVLSTGIVVSFFDGKNALQKDMETSAIIMSENLTAPLVFVDRDAGDSILDTLELKSSFLRAWVLDQQGLLFASAGLAPEFTHATQYDADNASSMMTYEQVITLDGDPIGTLYLEFSLKDIELRLRQGVLLASFSLVLATLMSFLLANRLQDPILGRLHQLSGMMGRIRQGERILPDPPAPGDQDEISQLSLSFRNLILEIEKRDQALQNANESLESRVRERTTELEIARDLAEKASQAKTEFLAAMSHEIRTPMNAIIGTASLMLHSRLKDEDREYLGIIQTSGEALLTLIDDILDLSKIEAGQLTLELETVDLWLLLKDVIVISSPRIVEKALDLGFHLDPKLPGAMSGDPHRLRQILLNLTSNAAKFTSEGYIQINIKVSDKAGMLRMEVIDSGIGIPPDKLETIFDNFSQADSSTTRKYGGTGLGLSISRRLAVMMGGDLYVESEMGKGSCFILEIPVHPRGTDNPCPFSADQFRDILQNRGVLVFQPFQQSAQSLETCFRHWGASAKIIPDWITFCQTFQEHPEEWDILVVQWAPLSEPFLPHLDQLFSRDQDDSHTPIILLSSQDTSSRGVWLPQVEAVVPYPFIPEKLLAQLCQQLSLQIPASLRPKDTNLSEKFRNMAAKTPLKILIAEDNRVNQNILKKILERLGYEPEIVENGLDAFQKITEATFDLVLMDVQMPVLDGLEATRKIRAEIPDKQQPTIIALTANAMPGDQEMCLKAGMDHYLSKPVKLGPLAEVLRQVRAQKAS